MTPLEMFQQHVADWNTCTDCELHRGRTYVVFARGNVPADICFIGEAPGFSEDALGQPMVGQAGQLMDDIIKQALAPTGTPTHTHIITNLICCIPKDETGFKTAEPPHESILACQPRLQEFLGIVKPRLVVAVGKVARDYLDQTYKYSLKLDPSIQIIDILHPAAILRSPVASRQLSVQRCVIQIATAAEAIEEGGPRHDLRRTERPKPRSERVAPPEPEPPYPGNDPNSPYDSYNDDIPF